MKAKPNIQATGLPTISGTARVGETLTADTSAIADEDGLDSAVFSYRWIRNDGTEDADIPGATGSTHTPDENDVGKTLKVRVSFTDDAGHEESLTSPPTAAVTAPPLTATLDSVPASHDGATEFTFELHFSEEFKLSYTVLRDDAFTVTGGTVSRATRVDKGFNIKRKIHVQPDGDGGVTIVLAATTDCAADGAICTVDGRKLSIRLELTVSGPGGAPTTTDEPAPNTQATGPAHHQRHRPGGRDPDGGHIRDRRRGRVDQPRLHLPVGQERRGHRYGHSGSHRLQLHPDRGRRGARPSR